MPRSGEQVRGRRARESLERGGDSLKGASGPRARRNLTQRGGQPSSEAEPYSRGRPALELRWSFVSAVSYPSSEAEFRPRVAGADCSGGLLGPPGPWAPATDLRLFWACFKFVRSFMFCYLRKKMSFPRLFRGPLWLSPTPGAKAAMTTGP
jgi:hypothetical protein